MSYYYNIIKFNPFLFFVSILERVNKSKEEYDIAKQDYDTKHKAFSECEEKRTKKLSDAFYSIKESITGEPLRLFMISLVCNKYT